MAIDRKKIAFVFLPSFKASAGEAFPRPGPILLGLYRVGAHRGDETDWSGRAARKTRGGPLLKSVVVGLSSFGATVTSYASDKESFLFSGPPAPGPAEGPGEPAHGNEKWRGSMNDGAAAPRVDAPAVSVASVNWPPGFEMQVQEALGEGLQDARNLAARERNPMESQSAVAPLFCLHCSCVFLCPRRRHFQSHIPAVVVVVCNFAADLPFPSLPSPRAPVAVPVTK